MGKAVLKGSAGPWVSAAPTQECILGKKSGLKTDGKSERSQQPFIKCPECDSLRIWKDGLRYVKSESGTIAVQRYICRDCGRRFSETSPAPPRPRKRKPSLGREKNTGLLAAYLRPNTSDYKANGLTSICQVCVSEAQGAKNLVKVKTRQKQAAGATKPDSATVKGKIVEYAWNLKRNGYAESTIISYSQILKLLTKRGADLYNQESVKDTIAMQDTWSSARKRNAVKAYNRFLEIEELTWKPPKYRATETLPFIPTEKEIDELIAGSSKQIATYLQLLKETGARRGEAFNLKWTDIDFVNNTVRITPEKGSNPRIFRISAKLATMLHTLPKTDNKKVWIYKNTFYLDRGFRRQRKRTANKLGNPRLLQIHFHTLRHWRATTEYARTKDILYVKQLLGHKNIKNTLKYTQLVNFPHEENFICKIAKNVEDATELIEAGFEYVTGEYMDGGKLFRKRKASYLGSRTVPKGSWSSLV
jgi:integrase